MLDYPFLRDVAFAVVLLYASRRYWPTSASAVHAAVLIHSLLSSYWLRRVNRAVNLPYLDEVFHVRQALFYWKGQWMHWDPKITTPPGLYLLSWPVITTGLWWSRWTPFLSLARGSNNISIMVLLVSLRCVVEPSGRSSPRTAAHAAFNLSLFPPLFFFCALYYTDVPSVLSVVVVYVAFKMERPLLVVPLGLVSLLFRQTNIFWVAVYLGGREVLRQLRRGKERDGFKDDASFLGLAKASWKHGAVYDPLVREAWFEDYFKTILSIGLAALAQLQVLIVPLMPYISLLGAFGAFVFWNHGVVLGDRKNHVASLNPVQMLYIWPYIAFFSFPVLLPSLIPSLLSVLPTGISRSLPVPIRPSRSTSTTIPRLVVLLPTLAATLAIVHYNTVIHPFTLADNRHYTFYVFRLLTRRPWTKYLVAPLYVFFGWACINALGGAEPVQGSSLTKDKGSSLNRSAEEQEATETAERGPRVSSVLLWLLASTLSLASTPLVEPRYFILPWLFWRLMVPTQSVAGSMAPGKEHDAAAPSTAGRRGKGWKESIADEARSSYALYLETLWFAAVNFATGYIFLNWGFEWPSEPGMVQRFMW